MSRFTLFNCLQYKLYQYKSPVVETAGLIASLPELRYLCFLLWWVSGSFFFFSNLIGLHTCHIVEVLTSLWGKVKSNMTIGHWCHYFCEFPVQGDLMERWEFRQISDGFSWSDLSSQCTCRLGYIHLGRWVDHKGKFPRTPSLAGCCCKPVVLPSHPEGKRTD